MDFNPREFLTGLFQQAVAAVHPSHVVSRNLPPKPRGRTIVVGAGKAAAAMAAAVEAAWPLKGNTGPLDGRTPSLGGSPERDVREPEALPLRWSSLAGP